MNAIEEALKKAVEQSDSTKVKILMARKTNQQRKKRRVIPKSIR